LPSVDVFVAFRVYVFTPRAAAPVKRIPATERTRAVLGFMAPL
jgi:hypothetical protein